MADSDHTNSRIWPQVIVSVIVLVVAISLSLLAVRLLKQEPAKADQQVALPLVKTVPVQLHQSGLTIEADGVVVPYRSIDLSAEVAGRIVHQADICRAGNYVEAGTLLYRIDPSDYQFSVQQLEKDVEQATVALAELAEQVKGSEEQIEVATKELALRQRELKRQQDLVGVVSSSDLERAEANELMARDNLITLKNRVRLYQVSKSRLESARDSASSKLAKANLDLERTQITAPVSGVVVQEHVELDTFVQRGTQLLTLEDTSKVEVKCKLEMEDLFWLWDRDVPSAGKKEPMTAARAYHIPESPVEIVYRIAGRRDLEYVWNGRLTRFDGIGLDERTRTVPCRVVVERPLERRGDASGGPPALVRGMYVSIRIHTQPTMPLLEIPEEALRTGNIVWRVRDGKLTIEKVNFISLLEPDDPTAKNQRALIWQLDHSRLVPGDQVVVSPLELVRSGMDVRIAAATASKSNREKN